MSYLTLEVDIDHGKVVPKEPDKMPESGRGLLTILQPAASGAADHKRVRQRVEAPLIRCKPGTVINPTPAELDASLWD
ncbi:MAG: hypothetical protein HY674_01355 [Chloroflexi bacterium]|nr:hypothetical protein [Chloroflexota bacterium]